LVYLRDRDPWSALNFEIILPRRAKISEGTGKTNLLPETK